MQAHLRKVGIVGIGNVGITTAYALLLRNMVDEVVLVSRSLDKAEGEKLDLEHGLPFLEPAKIVATTKYADLQDANVVIITAGTAQKPGQTRLDLVTENKKIMTELAKELKPFVQNSVVLVVSNPVDILTYELAELLNLPKGRVLGTGTMLDTARFRFNLSQIIKVHPRSIHAYILGEHGESSFPVLANATVGGQALADFPHFTDHEAQVAFAQAKDAAAKIIQTKGATFYAIGVVVSQIVHTILQDKKSVLPVSTVITEYLGQSHLAISVPCIVGKDGVEKMLHIQLSAAEQEKFKHSCEVIKRAAQG